MAPVTTAHAAPSPALVEQFGNIAPRRSLADDFQAGDIVSDFDGHRQFGIGFRLAQA